MLGEVVVAEIGMKKLDRLINQMYQPYQLCRFKRQICQVYLFFKKKKRNEYSFKQSSDSVMVTVAILVIIILVVA